MIEVPRVRVHVEAVDLHGEAPVAVRDARDSFTLGIDFNQPPEKIAAALEGILQQSADERWHRRGTCEQHQQDREAAPHPESGPY